ncbi:MAG: UbiD family decarboxylase domain-containing protein, partial [Candidatus Hermodarchaeota archaeon]
MSCNIFFIPFLIHHEKDAGPYITSGISVVKDK